MPTPPRAAWSALALSIGVIAVVLLASYDRMWGDTFLNLYAGRWIAEHGLPRTDPFTIAGAGRDWINSQWLANLAAYGAWKLGGYAAVVRGSIASLLVAYALVGVLLRRRGASTVALLALPLWGFLPASQLVFPRAQNLVLPLFVLLAWLILDDDHRAESGDRRRPWYTTVTLLATLVLWANLHGSAPMAAAFACAYGVWRLVRSRGRARLHCARSASFTLALVAPLTLLATPYGTDIFASHLAVMGNEQLQADTVEWASVLEPIGAVQSAVPAFVATIALAIAYRRRVPIQRPLLVAVVVLTLATL